MQKKRAVVSLLAGLAAFVILGLGGTSWGKIVAWYEFLALFESLDRNAQGYGEYRHRETGIVMVCLPGGEFDMGSPPGEASRGGDEGPVHTVTLSPFLIAKYEVTTKEYERVMAGHATLFPDPSYYKGDNLPVSDVSWDDLHLEDGFLDRTGLSLPSEAQWEYACRAGTSGPYAGTGNLDEMGWYKDNSNGRTPHPVGRKMANQFGLHDMHGNVFEWCEDGYERAFYGKPGARLPNPLVVPGKINSGLWGPVYRGGCFVGSATKCRSACRGSESGCDSSDVWGFRPARPLP